MAREDFHGQNAARSEARKIKQRIALLAIGVIVVFSFIGFGCSFLF